MFFRTEVFFVLDKEWLNMRNSDSKTTSSIFQPMNYNLHRHKYGTEVMTILQK